MEKYVDDSLADKSAENAVNYNEWYLIFYMLNKMLMLYTFIHTKIM